MNRRHPLLPWLMISSSVLYGCQLSPDPKPSPHIAITPAPRLAPAIPQGTHDEYDTAPIAESIIIDEQRGIGHDVRRPDAVTSLLNTAQQAELAQDYLSAQQALQRAQRIAPGDPAIYYRLANTHRSQQQYHLAEQIALKGISLVQGRVTQARRFWLLIAQIRLEQHDIIGAEQAEQNAKHP